MGYSLEVLILGLVATCPLWEGVQCQLENYKLNASRFVSVPVGFCVIIPCNFTYEPSHIDSRAPLYGYWYEKGKVPSRDAAVATNDRTKAIASYARNRFTLSGDLEQGDCSLTIKDAKKVDQRKYFFRVERETRARFSYSNFDTPNVNVTDLGKPEIWIPGKLRAGQPVNITCTAPASCPQKPPNMTWGGISEASTSGISAMLLNGTEVYRTVFNFRPSVAHDGQTLTCRVSYGKWIKLHIEATVRLNINYPPEVPQFSGELIRSNKSLQNFTSVTQISAREGDSVVLQCEAKGNPLPNVSWVKDPESSKTLEQVNQLSSDNELKLSSLNKQHEGKYECLTQNTEGSNKATFQLFITYSPRPCKKEMPHCWRDGSGFQCNCSLCASPSPKVKWQVDGETLEGNTTKGTMEVTTWTKEEVGTSTLRFTGHWDGEHRIICHGANLEGELPIMFFLFRSAAGNTENWWIICGVIGAFILFALVMLIITVILTSKKCRKGRKSVTGSKPYTEQPIAGQGKVLPNVKDSRIRGSNEVLEMPEKTNEAIYDNPNDPEDLHYASLHFNMQKNIPESLSEEAQTEYAEIKTS